MNRSIKFVFLLTVVFGVHRATVAAAAAPNARCIEKGVNFLKANFAERFTDHVRGYTEVVRAESPRMETHSGKQILSLPVQIQNPEAPGSDSFNYILRFSRNPELVSPCNSDNSFHEVDFLKKMFHVDLVSQPGDAFGFDRSNPLE